jgi:hypothetical protein
LLGLWLICFCCIADEPNQPALFEHAAARRLYKKVLCGHGLMREAKCSVPGVVYSALGGQLFLLRDPVGVINLNIFRHLGPTYNLFSDQGAHLTYDVVLSFNILGQGVHLFYLIIFLYDSGNSCEPALLLLEDSVDNCLL